MTIGTERRSDRSFTRTALPLIVLIIVVVGFNLPMFLRLASMPTDWEYHVEITQTVLLGGSFRFTHVLFHVLTVIFAFGQPDNVPFAGTLVGVTLSALTAVTLFFWLRPALRDRPFTLIVLCVAVMIATPITVLTLFPPKLYLGYVGLTTYHSPTMIVLRPLALLLFLLLSAAFERHLRVTPIVWIAAGGLTVLSTFAKPNFSLMLLPVLGIIGIVMIARREWRTAAFGLVVLVGGLLTVVLAGQYIVQYIAFSDPSDTEGGLAVGWLLGLSPLNYTPVELFVRTLLSLAFPLSVTFLALCGDARLRPTLRFAWALMIVGLLHVFLLAEAGRRAPDLNFAWGAQVGLLLLFAVCVRVWAANWALMPRLVRVVTTGLLLLHVVSGVIFWIHHYQTGIV